MGQGMTRTTFNILSVLFIALRLIGGTNIDNWSWWWVLSPFWVYLILCVITEVAKAKAKEEEE